MTTFHIQTLNAISPVGLQRLDRELFDIGTDIPEPRGILVRSADLHSMDVPPSLYAVARAGAGTNNIPVARLAALGIPVGSIGPTRGRCLAKLRLALLADPSWEVRA